MKLKRTKLLIYGIAFVSSPDQGLDFSNLEMNRSYASSKTVFNLTTCPTNTSITLHSAEDLHKITVSLTGNDISQISSPCVIRFIP